MLTCCDDEQMENFASSIEQAYALLGRCPSCMDNFARQYCDFTCHPQQSSFVEILATNETNKGIRFFYTILKVLGLH